MPEGEGLSAKDQEVAANLYGEHKQLSDDLEKASTDYAWELEHAVTPVDKPSSEVKDAKSTSKARDKYDKNIESATRHYQKHKDDYIVQADNEYRAEDPDNNLTSVQLGGEEARATLEAHKERIHQERARLGNDLGEDQLTDEQWYEKRSAQSFRDKQEENREPLGDL